MSIQKLETEEYQINEPRLSPEEAAFIRGVNRAATGSIEELSREYDGDRRKARKTGSATTSTMVEIPVEYSGSGHHVDVKVRHAQAFDAESKF